MSTKRRIGIVGFGHLGQYLYSQLPRSDFEVVFVWNRTKEALIGRVPDDVILDSLEDFEERKADLIVEVAHPDITRKLGVQFVQSADYMLVSPTALSDPDLMENLKKASQEHGVYVPSGALWGGPDIRKMDHQGDLKEQYIKEEEPDDKLRDSVNWKRQRMNAETVQELETEYTKQPKPSRLEIEKLATRLGQRENNIYAWFYRRRNREVRGGESKFLDSAEDEAEKLPTPPPSRNKRRNSRTSKLFSKEEMTVLENVFARQNHPGESEIEGLARWFQKDQRKISAWFARRRMKLTKDYVKNIDLDSYVSPTPDSVADDPPKLNPSLLWSLKRKDLDIKDESDDEECDVVRLSPTPSTEENFKLACSACGPQDVLQPVFTKPDGILNTSRESVIQWHHTSNKADPVEISSEVLTSADEFRTEVKPLSSVQEQVEDSELPQLVPIDWLFRYPQIPGVYGFPKQPFNLPQHLSYFEHCKKMFPETYSSVYYERESITYSQMKSVNGN